MKALDTTLNIQHAMLNLEYNGRVPVPIIGCWALEVECSMFPENSQP